MKTINASSPSVSAAEIWVSLIAFVLIYIVLGAADLVLMLRYSRIGLGHEESSADQSAGDQPGSTAVAALTY
jgi:cytochrome bd-type quinol oxidase subunit 1